MDMIRKLEMRLMSKKQIARDTYEFQLESKYVAEQAIPGQFLHIEIENYTLRRPISIANIDKENDLVTILFKVVGDGTRALSRYEIGRTLDVLGPNGNGFTYNHVAGKHILLVGGGIGVPPLYYLGKELKKSGADITTVLGFQSKDHVFYEDDFGKIGQTFVTTDDGSYGEKGFVTEVCKRLKNIDYYYTVGPIPMLRSVIHTMCNAEGSISLEERMGCGIGACYACVIKSRKDETDYYKICEDGPVFKSNEVAL